MDRVGVRIKQIRTSKGITQTELAGAIGTTKGVISRYEHGKRELRFTQAQGIADFLGVPVFELYGLPSEKQRWMKESQKLLADIRERIRRGLEENPDEMMQKVDDILRSEADRIERELHDAVGLASIIHGEQAEAALVDQPDEKKGSEESPRIDPAIRLRNKRVDNLVAMFSAYPRDVQNRILDIVGTFVQLNGVGQKHALGRMKELAELPRYQAQQEGC